MTLGARLRAVLTTVGLCGAVLSAPLLDDSEGAFPLSRYPMFATARRRVEALPFVVAVLDDGSERLLDARWFADGGGASNGRNQLSALTRASPPARLAFCQSIVARLHASPEAFTRDVAEVRIAMGFFARDRAVRTGDLVPARREPIARCPAR